MIAGGEVRKLALMGRALGEDGRARKRGFPLFAATVAAELRRLDTLVLGKPIRASFIREAAPELDLSDGAGYGREDLTAVAELLKHNSALTALRLSGCSITDDGQNYAGCDALGEWVMDASALTRLDLADSDLRDEGILRLARGVHEASSLVDLRLARNGLRVGGLHALALALPGLRALRALDLAGNDLSCTDEEDGGLFETFAAGLRACAALEELRLDGCALRDGGAVALSHALQRLSALRVLLVGDSPPPPSVLSGHAASLTPY